MSEKFTRLPQDEPSAEHPLEGGQEARVRPSMGQEVETTSVETRNNPGGILAEEEDEELNISGAHGGPKLPKQ